MQNGSNDSLLVMALLWYDYFTWDDLVVIHVPCQTLKYSVLGTCRVKLCMSCVSAAELHTAYDMPFYMLHTLSSG